MADFYGLLTVRAATVDERLTDAFEALPGSKSDADLAARRLAAWCRSAASGDWLQFERRLSRDGLSTAAVLARFATVRRTPSAPLPGWVEDAIWIETALHSQASDRADSEGEEPCEFEQLLSPVVAAADRLLWAAEPERVRANVAASARACLRRLLLKALSTLLAPALYERFAGTRKYHQFVEEMKSGGFRRLFEDKPVLLRLAATVTRQWIDSSHELASRLDADLAAIRRDLLPAGPISGAGGRVVRVDGDLADPHNQGRSVQIIAFEDGSRVVYKPKDLRLDVAWHALFERLNAGEAPLQLKAARTISRDGYGWSEFVDHTGCADAQGCARFFQRAGALLALFHCFSGTDIHHENMVAAGEYPVAVDLEMVLQPPPEEHVAQTAEARAFNAAKDIIGNSVMAVGLLPTYARALDNSIFGIGGVKSGRLARNTLTWNDINSDRMLPTPSRQMSTSTTNLPHFAGRYAKLANHIDDFICGFERYARFLQQRSRDPGQGGLLDGFEGLPTRKVIRPTRFYSMLMQRLTDHRSMDDGVVWSAQADFVARLADWDTDVDPLWPMHSAERDALLALSIPHFVGPTDVDRARARIRSFDDREIAWQLEVIRQSTAIMLKSTDPADPATATPLLRTEAATTPDPAMLLAHAGGLAAELSRHAIREGPGAAWIGLDWLGDAEVSRLVALGPQLYNGVCGIAVFLAAHAALAGSDTSGDLALAALANLRQELRSRNAAHMLRALGIGGGSGLGSIIYAFSVASGLLDDAGLLADAHLAAELMTDGLIAADQQFDVMDGSAGAILGLLRLFRQSGSQGPLDRAIACGRHLLAQQRGGSPGQRSWRGQSTGSQPLNGMSHGAAGFAYALAALGSTSGHDEFLSAAAECIEFENSAYDPDRKNWPDLRFAGPPNWPCQWCHGACGIGLGRLAMIKYGAVDSGLLLRDAGNALMTTEQGWPSRSDTLCCGTLGNVEFFSAAARAFGRSELQEQATRRLTAVLDTAAATGDFRWTSGNRRFNLGLFRGLAGVGYTVLRQVDTSLPNVLIWE